MKVINIFFASILISMLFLNVSQASNDDEKALIILDCSTAMNREVAGERMIYSSVREVVKFVSRIGGTKEVGLIVFGHTEKRCDDAELIVPFSRGNADMVRTELAKITPRGNRGVIHAIEEGFKALDDSALASVYLITSGTDQCGARVHHLRDAAEKYNANLQVTIIGLDIHGRDEDNLKEIASLFNGRYQSVPNPQRLESVFREVVESTRGNVNITIQGMDFDTGQVTLRIYDDRGTVVETARITGFHSTDLDTGVYDFELMFEGRAIWHRDIFIEKEKPSNFQFDLKAELGELKLEILDMFNRRMKGNITIYDSTHNNVVYEAKNMSEFLVSLPEGFYSAEVQVGSEIESFDYIEVRSDSVTSFPAMMNVITGNAEIVINNYDGIPVHASVTIEDEFGNIVGEVDYTSTYRINLPPGFYTAIAVTSAGYQQSTEFYMSDGDNITVDVVIDVPIGSVYVMLRTTRGHDVWGRIRVFDERGRLIPHFQYESIEDADFTFDVPEGTYRIQGEVDGVIRTADGIQVRAGDEAIVELIFPDDLA